MTEEDQQLVNAYFSIRNSLYSKDPTINGIIRDTEKDYGLGTHGLADARRGHTKKEAEELAKQGGEGIVHVGGDVYRLDHEQQAVEDYQQRLYDYLQNIQQGEATDVKEPKRLEMQEQQPTGGGESEGPTDGGTPTTPQTPTGTAQEPTPTTGEPPKAEEKPAQTAGQQPTPAADQGAGTAQSQGEGAMPSWKEKAQEAYNRGASVSEDNLQDLPKMQQEISLANERFNQAFAKSLGTFRNGLIYALDNGDDDQVDQLMQQFGDRLTPTQKAAAEGLIQAANMQQGLDAAVANDTGEYIDGRRQQLEPLADGQGNITPLTLQDGKTVYYKQGDLQNSYGGVIVTDENGETKQIPVNSIKEVGEVQPLQTILDNESNEYAKNLQDSYAQLPQGRAVYPGQEVNLNIGGQTVHAIAEQQNVDGSYTFRADDGSAFVLNPDELQQAVQAQSSVDTTNQLQQEKVEEAQRQQTERYTKGIKGFAEGNPDYTAKETDPKVAGEYLRAQDEQEGKKPEERLSRMQLKMNALKASAEGDAGTIEHMQNVLNIMSPSSPDYETRKKMLEDLKAKREEKLRQLRKLGELRNAYMTPEERDEEAAKRINHISDVRKKIKGDIDALKGAAQNGQPTVKGISNEELLANFKTQNEAAEHLAKTREGLIKVYRDGPGADIARINRELNDYKEGLTELDDDEIADKLKQLATAERIEKEDLANIKAVKDQEKKLSTLYKDRNKQELDKLSPADRRRAILGSATSLDDLRKKAKEVYKDSEMASRLDELEPETLEEYISQNLQPHSINWEGKGDNATSQRGLGQETGLKRGIGKNGDSNAINYFLAPKGEGESVDDIVHHLWEDMPDAWRDRYDDRDIKNTLLTMLTSAKNANEISGMTLHNRIRDVEDFEANEERQEAWYKEQADEDAKQRQRDIETYDDYLNETADELAISPEADNFLNGLYADELAEAAQHDKDMEEAWSQIEEDKEHNDNNENDEGTKQGVTRGSHVDRQSERRPVHDRGSKGQKIVRSEESHKPTVEGSDHQQPEATHQSKASQVRDSSTNGSVSVPEGARDAGVSAAEGGSSQNGKPEIHEVDIKSLVDDLKEGKPTMLSEHFMDKKTIDTAFNMAHERYLWTLKNRYHVDVSNSADKKILEDGLKVHDKWIDELAVFLKRGENGVTWNGHKAVNVPFTLARVLGERQALSELLNGERKKPATLFGEDKSQERKPVETGNYSIDRIVNIPVEKGSWPRSLTTATAKQKGWVVERHQKAGKRADGVTVRVGFVDGNLYIQTNKGGVYVFPGARSKYSAVEINGRINEGIGTTEDAARLMNDAIYELYQKTGLPITQNHITRPMVTPEMLKEHREKEPETTEPKDIVKAAQETGHLIIGGVPKADDALKGAAKAISILTATTSRLRTPRGAPGPEKTQTIRPGAYLCTMTTAISLVPRVWTEIISTCTFLTTPQAATCMW